MEGLKTSRALRDSVRIMELIVISLLLTNVSLGWIPCGITYLKKHVL